MPLIARTRLYQVSTQTLVRTFAGEVYHTVADAALASPLAIRTAVQANPGDFVLDWEPACAYQVTILGLSAAPHRHLTIEATIWASEAARLANDPPVAQNTFLFQIRPGMFSGMTGAQKRGWFRQHLVAWLKRVGLREALGQAPRDERHPRLALAGDDPQGLLDDADIQALNGTIVELT